MITSAICFSKLKFNSIKYKFRTQLIIGKISQYGVKPKKLTKNSTRNLKMISFIFYLSLRFKFLSTLNIEMHRIEPLKYFVVETTEKWELLLMS